MSGGQEPSGYVPRAGLPDGAPDDLTDFLRCRRDQVVLEAGRIDWIPRPRLGPIPLPDVPASVSFRPAGEAAVDIVARWGPVTMVLPASVRSGRLHIDTSRVRGIGGSVRNWVDAVNHDLEANGKRLTEVRMQGDDLFLAKAPGAPGDEGTRRRKVAAGLAGGAIVAGGAAAVARRRRR